MVSRGSQTRCEQLLLALEAGSGGNVALLELIQGGERAGTGLGNWATCMNFMVRTKRASSSPCQEPVVF